MTGTIAPAARRARRRSRSVADDLWALGLAPEATAISLARARARRDAACCPRRRSLGAETSRVVVAGVVTHRQHPETAHGAVFVNLEDETGHVNVIFSKGAWARWRHVAATRARARRSAGASSARRARSAVTAEHVDGPRARCAGRGLEGLPLTGTHRAGRSRAQHPGHRRRGRRRARRLVAVAVALAATGLERRRVVTVATSSSVPAHRRPRRACSPTRDSSGISISADCAFDFAAGTADVDRDRLAQHRDRDRRGAARRRTTLYLQRPAVRLARRRAVGVDRPRQAGRRELDELAATCATRTSPRLHPARRRPSCTPTGARRPRLSFGLVHLPSSAGLPISLPATAVVTATVVTGSQGQLLAVAAAPGGPQRRRSRCTFLVTGYDVPVAISAADHRATWSCSTPLEGAGDLRHERPGHRPRPAGPAPPAATRPLRRVVAAQPGSSTAEPLRGVASGPGAVRRVRRVRRVRADPDGGSVAGAPPRSSARGDQPKRRRRTLPTITSSPRRTASHASERVRRRVGEGDRPRCPPAAGSAGRRRRRS